MNLTISFIYTKYMVPKFLAAFLNVRGGLLLFHLLFALKHLSPTLRTCPAAMFSTFLLGHVTQNEGAANSPSFY